MWAERRFLDAVKKAVSPDTRVEYSSSGNFAFKDANGNPLKADVTILVLAEPPYAEGVGDRSRLELEPTDSSAN